MFRQKALKKGHLKTINANTGIMVGQPISSAPVPALRPTPTFMERMAVSGPARFLRGAVSIPSIGGYMAGETVARGLGIENPIGQMGFGTAGSIAATKALPGLASLPAATSAALLAGPAYLTIAGAKERERIAKMTPKEREAHRRKSMMFGSSYLDDDQFEEQFGKFVPKPPEEFKTRTSATKKGPGSGRVGFESRSKQLKAEGDELLADNVATSDDIANLDKVQENSISVAPVPPGSDDEDTTTAKKETTETSVAGATEAEKKGFKEEDQKQSDNEINVGGVSDDADFNKTIALAKRYRDEVYGGRGSQANLVFLANLASGLLTGTTKKSGLGGALEVLGQAIGPAVNNYATIKLKEGELRQNAREASLNAALDHMKFLNEAQEVERPEIDRYGVIQVRGTDGRLRNYRGVVYKNGTAALPAGLGADGLEQYVPIQQQGDIVDSTGTKLGRFENFLEQKNVDKRLFEIQDILGNRYNALSVTRDVLKTLNQMDETGEPVKAGAALSIDQFTRRLLE